MPDDRSVHPQGGSPLPPDVVRDARALRELSARTVPPLASSMAKVRHRRPDPGRHWKERFAMSILSRSGRTGLVTAAIVALLAVAMLVVPISYDRTTGHRVAVTLSGAGPDAPVRAMAHALGTALHGAPVAVNADDRNGVFTFTLESAVPTSRGVDARAVADAFARGLAARGWHAAAVTTAIVEHVSNSAYAYARDLVIRVQTDGKTAAQIEAEIRQQLADANLPDAKVSVTDEGHARKVSLEVKRQSAANTEPLPSDISIQLSGKGGTTPSHGLTVRESQLRSGNVESLRVEVNQDGRTVAVDIPNPGALSDDALAAAVRSKLLQAGLDLKVTASNGRVMVETK